MSTRRRWGTTCGAKSAWRRAPDVASSHTAIRPGETPGSRHVSPQAWRHSELAGSSDISPPLPSTKDRFLPRQTTRPPPRQDTPSTREPATSWRF